jgi:hypothetical protein
VAISSDGKTVIVGAPFHDDWGLTGHARVFRRDGTSWARVFEIDGEGRHDEFGTSVAISSDGNTVVIGAPNNRVARARVGHARVYRWNNASWVQVGGDIDGEPADHEFGKSVAMSSDGSTVVIGALYSNRARVYRWNGTGFWVQVGGDIDGGGAVAMSSDGGTVIIGGPYWAGHARVYRLVEDSDGDGVVDRDDVCADTVIPDPTVPTKRLGTNRWALVDGDGAFDTFHPRGKAPTRSFTIVDTGGCNAEQIADALRLGKGHYKYGLSTDAMNRWVRFVGN